jgi:hypothetical protein
MLHRHPFLEGALVSVGEAARSPGGYDLTDMEGAFAYEAALTFMPSSRIYCVKIISDRMRPELVTAESVTRLFARTAGEIRAWLHGIGKQETPRKKPGGSLPDEECALMDLTASKLRMTYSTDRIFRRACRDAKIRGLDVNVILAEYSAHTAREKHEKSAAFAGLMRRLSEERQ